MSMSSHKLVFFPLPHIKDQIADSATAIARARSTDFIVVMRTIESLALASGTIVVAWLALFG